METVFSIEDYAAQLAAAEFTDCDECGKNIAVCDVIETEFNEFCSISCRDRAMAPLIKPQPKRTLCDGWDI